MGNLADRGVGGGDNRLLDGSAAFGAYTEYRHARGGTYSDVSAGDRRLNGDGARFAMDRPVGAWETRIVRELVERESRVLVLRASALAGCLRKVYYAVMDFGGDDEASARDEAVRDAGSALEPVIMDMLRKGDSLDDGRLDDGWLIEGDQIEVVHALDGIEIQGHIDFVGSHPRWTRGQAVVVDLKTRSNSQKEYASAVGVERSHRSAALQAALYAVAFAGSMADARGAAVITVSRDDMSYAVNYIPRERVVALYAECVYRAGELKAALEREEPPDPEYPAGHKICRQCEFRGVCGNAVLEDALMRRDIPYQVIGGVKFYQRQEIKDALAYLRLLINPDDEVSFARIVNVPPRDVGAITLSKLTDFASERGMSRYSAIPGLASADALGGSAPLPPKAIAALTGFYELMEYLRGRAEKLDVSELINETLVRSGYMESLERDSRGEDRIDNIRSFIGGADDRPAETFGYDAGESPLVKFLESVSLVVDTDRLGDVDDAVTLITLHQAKGLEFPVVFLAGVEEDLLPHKRSINDSDDAAGIEEERRLFYVGMTRAMERLYLVHAASRRLFGKPEAKRPSRFLADLPEAHTRLIDLSGG